MPGKSTRPTVSRSFFAGAALSRLTTSANLLVVVLGNYPSRLLFRKVPIRIEETVRTRGSSGRCCFLVLHFKLNAKIASNHSPQFSLVLAIVLVRVRLYCGVSGKLLAYTPRIDYHE